MSRSEGLGGIHGLYLVQELACGCVRICGVLGRAQWLCASVCETCRQLGEAEEPCGDFDLWERETWDHVT